MFSFTSDTENATWTIEFTTRKIYVIKHLKSSKLVYELSKERPEGESVLPFCSDDFKSAGRLILEIYDDLQFLSREYVGWLLEKLKIDYDNNQINRITLKLHKNAASLHLLNVWLNCQKLSISQFAIVNVDWNGTFDFYSWFDSSNIAYKPEKITNEAVTTGAREGNLDDNEENASGWFKCTLSTIKEEDELDKNEANEILSGMSKTEDNKALDTIDREQSESATSLAEGSILNNEKLDTTQESGNGVEITETEENKSASTKAEEVNSGEVEEILLSNINHLQLPNDEIFNLSTLRINTKDRTDYMAYLAKFVKNWPIHEKFLLQLIENEKEVAFVDQQLIEKEIGEYEPILFAEVSSLDEIKLLASFLEHRKGFYTQIDISVSADKNLFAEAWAGLGGILVEPTSRLFQVREISTKGNAPGNRILMNRGVFRAWLKKGYHVFPTNLVEIHLTLDEEYNTTDNNDIIAGDGKMNATSDGVNEILDQFALWTTNCPNLRKFFCNCGKLAERAILFVSNKRETDPESDIWGELGTFGSYVENPEIMSKVFSFPSMYLLLTVINVKEPFLILNENAVKLEWSSFLVENSKTNLIQFMKATTPVKQRDLDGQTNFDEQIIPAEQPITVEQTS